MLKTTLAAILAAPLLSTAALAQPTVLDGATCRMDLTVREMYREVLPGAPLHPGPADAHLSLQSVDDPGNPLCQRALSARAITMNAVHEQIGEPALEVGDRITATVSYHRSMAGKMLYDTYHHVAIIEAGGPGPRVYRGLGLLP